MARGVRAFDQGRDVVQAAGVGHGAAVEGVREAAAAADDEGEGG